MDNDAALFVDPEWLMFCVRDRSRLIALDMAAAYWGQPFQFDPKAISAKLKIIYPKRGPSERWLKKNRAALQRWFVVTTSGEWFPSSEWMVFSDHLQEGPNGTHQNH